MTRLREIMSESELQSPAIPTPSDVSSGRFESYEDPDLHFDLLPMPYRMLDSLLWDLFHSAWSVIMERQKLFIMDDGILIHIGLGDAIIKEPTTHLFGVIENFIGLSTKNKVVLYGREQLDKSLGEFICDEHVIRTFVLRPVDKILSIIMTVDDMGKAFIILALNGRMRVVKSVSQSQDGKSFHVLTGHVSVDGRVCTFVVQDKETREIWLEVYSLPVENWIKETGLIQRAMERPISKEQMSEGSRISDNVDAMDVVWNEVNLSIPVLYCKIKAPVRFTVSNPLEAQLKQKGSSQKQSKRKDIADVKPVKQGNTKKTKGSKSQPNIQKHQEDEDDSHASMPNSGLVLTDSSTAHRDRNESSPERSLQLDRADNSNPSGAVLNLMKDNEFQHDVSKILTELVSPDLSTG
ncbi:unnamed protein product [Echinostoma caproni]|uniref:Uncharacterized protein n=1 Tax=Echinostoma caproni TaxID=27848 RepID=A0A183AWI0_9TREM|nr:unnamed protein product [Echinostoma caproni]